jgi:dihydropteroate synthase
VGGERPLIMGVVNVTPDSFSDGGQFLDADAAVAHGLQLMRDGADIVDVGGEATNPRARPVTASDELARVIPVVERLTTAGATVSIDTSKSEVARAAVAAGATIVNDVSGGRFDPAIAEVVDDPRVTYIVGHLRGETLAAVFAAEQPTSWEQVARELGERLARLPATARARAWVDPGLGFGKGSDPAGNLALIRHAGDLAHALGGRTVVIGASRKRFLRRLLAGGADATEAELDAASVGASLAAVRSGATVLRVHNVTLLRAALTVYTKI